MGRRIRWIGVMLMLCFALVIVQLANIQFHRATALATSPYNPRVSINRFDNLRGTITAADGTILAQSVLATSGAYKYERIYPAGNINGVGNIYAGLTGYASIFFGTSGIEYQYNHYLEAHPQQSKNLSQLIFNKPPPAPDSVTLTIDPVLQNAAWQALTTLPPGPNKDGAVVVLNPTTGAVMAMVSNPTFDPNNLSNPNVTVERGADYANNQRDHEGYKYLEPMAIQHAFAPGSTFKVVTSTAVFNLDPSLENFNFKPAACVKFGDSTVPLCNSGGSPCGGTMITMLPASCDPGYASLGVAVGVPLMSEQAGLFGFSLYGSKHPFIPKLDLPNVQPSVFSALQPGDQAYLAQSSIGQYNTAATPLGNALVAAGLANGGVIMTPHLMAQITDAEGNVVTTYQPTPMLRAASQTAAASVDDLMQGVATHGTAAGVGFPAAWQVAVKTGTAQFPSAGGLTEDWMIGFMPSKGTPRLAFAVVVPNQQKDLTGALVAGPIVKAVLGAYINETGAP
jgi:peptidoglycan glycosyltransferase